MQSFYVAAALFALGLARASEVDLCDSTATAPLLMRQSVRPRGCTDAFDTEAALLGAACFAEESDGKEAEGDADDAAVVCLMMRRGWWQAAQRGTRGLADDGKLRVRRYAEAARAGASEVVQLLLRGGSTAMRYGEKESSTVTPACQWAQSAAAVRLATRLRAPLPSAKWA